MIKQVSILTLCFAAGACASSAPQLNTTVLLAPDVAGPEANGIAKSGDVFITARQQAAEGVILNEDVDIFMTLGGASARRGEALFKTVMETGQQAYCTQRKAVNALLTYNERFSACFIDADDDGAFERAGMLDFRNELAFGSGKLRHETEIDPARYQVLPPGEAPYQRVGVKYLGSGHSLRSLNEGRQFSFRWVAEKNGEWKSISDSFDFHIGPDERKPFRAFGGVYELSRTADNNLAYREVTAIQPRLQQNQVITVIRSRY